MWEKGYMKNVPSFPKLKFQRFMSSIVLPLSSSSTMCFVVEDESNF